MYRIVFISLLCSLAQSAKAEDAVEAAEKHYHLYLNMGGIASFSAESGELDGGYGIAGFGLGIPITKKLELEPEVSVEAGTNVAVVGELAAKYHLHGRTSFDLIGLLGRDQHDHKWETVFGGGSGLTHTRDGFNITASLFAFNFPESGRTEVRNRLTIQWQLTDFHKHVEEEFTIVDDVDDSHHDDGHSSHDESHP